MTGPAPRSGTWPARAHQVLDRLPAGTVDAGLCSVRTAVEVLRRAGATSDPASGPRSSVAGGPSRPVMATAQGWATGSWVAERLIEPLLLTDDWPEPTPPFPVGAGAVHADLTDDDHALFADLRQHLGSSARAGLTAEELAATAQELRLPVTPYRRPAEVTPLAAPPPAGSSRRRPWDRGGRPPLVIDLTALWAGPLATSLLARLGAEVVKVDPSCRPDGLGEERPVYHALNGDKTIVDLDLRLAADRARFEALAAEADLVVDSFSRRVMPNFGYAPETLHQRFGASTLSIVAFPAGTPEQDWVSYGPGVHAMSGLAYGSDGEPRSGPEAAPIAYPDVLAGLAAFASSVDLLTGTAPHHREVSLAGALASLGPRGAAEGGRP